MGCKFSSPVLEMEVWLCSMFWLCMKCVVLIFEPY